MTKKKPPTQTSLTLDLDDEDEPEAPPDDLADRQRMVDI